MIEKTDALPWIVKRVLFKVVIFANAPFGR